MDPKAQALKNAQAKVNAQKQPEAGSGSGLATNGIEPLQNALAAQNMQLATDLQVATKQAIEDRELLVKNFLTAAEPLFDGSVTAGLLIKNLGPEAKGMNTLTVDIFCSQVGNLISASIADTETPLKISAGIE